MTVFAYLANLTTQIDRENHIRHQLQGRHDADDRIWLIVQNDLLVDDVRIRAETLVPQFLSENGDLGTTGVIFAGNKSSTQQRRYAYYAGVVSGNVRHCNPCRVAATGESEGIGLNHRECIEGGGSISECRKLVARQRKICSSGILTSFPDNNQLIGILEWQGPQQNRIDDAEDRCVRTNPERKSKQRNSSEAFAFRQAPKAMANVVNERFHGSSPFGDCSPLLVFGLWSLVFALWSLVFGLRSLVLDHRFYALPLNVVANSQYRNAVASGRR